MSSCSHPHPMTRRHLLSMLGSGFGLTAFAGLTGTAQPAFAQEPTAVAGALSKLHFAPKAKRVIFILMNGGVSHVDTFDPKPMLTKYHGQPTPNGFTPYPDGRKPGTLMGSPFSFKKYGQSGMDFSSLWPMLGEHADSIAMIRSMHADIPNHEPCLSLLNTGFNIIGQRPSMGSWLVYGLGTENANLPGYVVLLPDLPLSGGPQFWSSAFLPSYTQGQHIRNQWTEGQPLDIEKLIPNIGNDAVDRHAQRSLVDRLRRLNELHKARTSPHDSQLDGTIKTMETAFQMQTTAPDAFDVTKERRSVQEAYGTGSVALGCMTAVRLVERGVRFVQVYTGKGDPWDAHVDIMSYVRLAKEADRAYATMLTQLKERGLWDDTLVIGATEMGRTPSVEVRGASGVAMGRDHNHHAFSIWLAGGAIKGGTIYGSTDDMGFKAEENPVHIYDLQATILHLLGIDHTRLTFHYSGRDFRLTDTEGNVVHDIIA